MSKGKWTYASAATVDGVGGYMLRKIMTDCDLLCHFAYNNIKIGGK